MKVIRKAKDNYLYDIKQSKYFDLRYNTNIIGFSNKKLTTVVKNSISSCWNIKDNSICHNRFKTFISKKFGDQYILTSATGLKEFFLLLKNFFSDHSFTFYGERFQKYLNQNKITFNETKNSKNVAIFDMSELY
ncbi:MAG TPA: hypothetical protein PK771_14245, partial [Spirochaetota bacterium]|nr:hypothetical protein [Spirochaetota bacterium]